MSDLCRVCLVFPPLVSIYGLFPVLVSCHYELIRFQVCVIMCLLSGVFKSCLLSSISSGLLVTPGVSVSLPCPVLP